MDNYSVGEIVWAKLKGYPWWPAKISGTNEINGKEKNYHVVFIGDNSHSYLPIKFLCKYRQNYKSFSTTKKLSLLNSIKQANSLLEASSLSKSPKQKKLKDEDIILPKSDIPTQDNNTLQDNKSLSVSISMLNKKRKREPSPSKSKAKSMRSNASQMSKDSLLSLGGDEDDKQRKISFYLIYIAKSLEKKDYQVLKKDKKCIKRVLYFLRIQKIADPIEFLKVNRTNIGKLVRSIANLIPKDVDLELKQEFDLVYRYLEDQLIAQLFQKNK